MEYSKKDIEEAKKYLRLRVEAETSMTHHVGVEMEKAANEVIAVCKRFSIDPTNLSFDNRYEIKYAINDIIDRLIDTLYNDCEELSCFTNKQDKDYIIAYLKDGSRVNLSENLSEHAQVFKDEMQDFVKIGLVAGSFGKWTRNWNGFSHKGLSSFHLIERLTRFAIADAWMHADIDYMKTNGAIGYMQFRGSSYPCEPCDDLVGFHNIDEYTLPVHANCKCYAVPIYE